MLLKPQSTNKNFISSLHHVYSPLAQLVHTVCHLPTFPLNRVRQRRARDYQIGQLFDRLLALGQVALAGLR